MLSVAAALPLPFLSTDTVQPHPSRPPPQRGCDMAVSETWVTDGGGAPRSLALFYHSVNVLILFLGLVAWLRVAFLWRRCFHHTTLLLRSYLAVSLADIFLLVTFLPLSLGGLAHGVPRESVSSEGGVRVGKIQGLQTAPLLTCALPVLSTGGRLCEATAFIGEPWTCHTFPRTPPTRLSLVTPATLPCPSSQASPSSSRCRVPMWPFPGSPTPTCLRR